MVSLNKLYQAERIGLLHEEKLKFDLVVLKFSSIIVVSINNHIFSLEY